MYNNNNIHDFWRPVLYNIKYYYFEIRDGIPMEFDEYIWIFMDENQIGNNKKVFIN